MIPWIYKERAFSGMRSMWQRPSSRFFLVSEIMAKATMLVRIWAVAIAREAGEECDLTFRIKFD
jgi:hypothetical protein